MYKSIILPLAQIDVQDAALWYNSRRKGLGSRFIKEVREKVNFIKQNPNASSIRYDNVRTTVLNNFPYMIHYVADNTNKLIIVSAVLNTSQNPEIWANR